MGALWGQVSLEYSNLFNLIRWVFRFGNPMPVASAKKSQKRSTREVL